MVFSKHTEEMKAAAFQGVERETIDQAMAAFVDEEAERMVAVCLLLSHPILGENKFLCFPI